MLASVTTTCADHRQPSSEEHGTRAPPVSLTADDSSTSCPPCREAAKMVLLAPLAIVRLLLIVLTLLTFAMLCAVATIGAPKDKPFAPWRRRIVRASRHLGKLVVILLGFWVTVKGWDNYEEAVKNGTVRASAARTPSVCFCALRLCAGGASNTAVPAAGPGHTLYPPGMASPRRNRAAVSCAEDHRAHAHSSGTSYHDIMSWHHIRTSPRAAQSRWRSLCRRLSCSTTPPGLTPSSSCTSLLRPACHARRTSGYPSLAASSGAFRTSTCRHARRRGPPTRSTRRSSRRARRRSRSLTGTHPSWPQCCGLTRAFL
jgi:hypothetical protein